MTDTKHNAFEAWLDEPHPADSQFTRRDYMPKNDGGFSAMAWQAATIAGRMRADDLYARFTDRCKIAQQCIPESKFKDMVVALHNVMLEELKP